MLRKSYLNSWLELEMEVVQAVNYQEDNKNVEKELSVDGMTKVP